MHLSLVDWIYAVATGLLMTEVFKLLLIYVRRKKLKPSTPAVFPFVSVIIPARNEADCIADCLAGILSQDYPADRYEVIVVDDHSRDATPRIIRSFVSQHANLIGYEAPGLPAGWSGKSHANHFASKKARGEYLLFLDADVVVKPTLLSSLISEVMQHHDEVKSIIVSRTLLTAVEKIFMPPLFLMIAIAFSDRRVKLTGECILFSRKLYDRIGGHAAIMSTVSDDLDFSLLLEQQGLHSDFLFAERFAGTRMYNRLGEIIGGFSKMFQRLLSENTTLAAWRSFKYGCFGLLYAFTLPVCFFPAHSIYLNHDVACIFSALCLTLLVAECLALNILPLFAVVMPAGWIMQPFLLLHSWRGRKRKYFEWSGRKVFMDKP